jgi:D-glycero-D-manno-heptose 1,7-bisphosphate phosphatase
MNRAVFLDLNGTLANPVQVEKLDDLKPISGAIESVARLDKSGFLCPVVTVQSRISKEIFSLKEFSNWFKNFSDEAKNASAKLLGPYICPHREKEDCECAKPKGTLYYKAAKEYSISLTDSFVIGDTQADILAASKIGSKACLVKTGWGYFESNINVAKKHNAYISENINQAVSWVLSNA